MKEKRESLTRASTAPYTEVQPWLQQRRWPRAKCSFMASYNPLDSWCHQPTQLILPTAVFELYLCKTTLPLAEQASRGKCFLPNRPEKVIVKTYTSVFILGNLGCLNCCWTWRDGKWEEVGAEYISKTWTTSWEWTWRTNHCDSDFVKIHNSFTSVKPEPPAGWVVTDVMWIIKSQLHQRPWLSVSVSEKSNLWENTRTAPLRLLLNVVILNVACSVVITS